MKAKYKILILCLSFLFSFKVATSEDRELERQNSWVNYSTVYYMILNNPPTLSMFEVQETMLKAFDTWAVDALIRHTFILKEFPFDDYNYEKQRTDLMLNISFIPTNFSSILNKADAGLTIKYGNEILFNNNIQWKKYKVGEKVDTKSIDFYTIALFTVGKFFGWETTKDQTSIMFEGYRDSKDANGNYIEPGFSESDLEKRYSWNWRKELGILCYTIFNNPPTLSMIDVKQTMLKAFNTWTLIFGSHKFQELPASNLNVGQNNCITALNITFEPTNHSTNIFDFSFRKNDAGHSINFLFIHFNKDIKWRKYKVGEKVDDESTDFYTIALFTIGQMHGWETTKDQTSIMFEGYRDSKDENGNYIEPGFSKSDLEYSINYLQKVGEFFYTEEEFKKEAEKTTKEKATNSNDNVKF